MALLFVAGVMNLLWVAAIAGVVLIENVATGGDRLGRVAGVALAGWGRGWSRERFDHSRNFALRRFSADRQDSVQK